MEARSNKLQAKDLINVGIFTAIYFVIFFAGMMLGYIPIFIPLLGLVCPILCGIPFMLYLEKVKAIMAFMTEEPERHFTMEELSEKFDISTSALKQCFKGVYGIAIYTYMRNYRMDLAASLLTQTNEPITVIAGKVGYTNTSKFSEAFKKVKGKTPLEYRKIKI